MRSDYTSNGMHKDDPTNPQSHWNDWSIDRDGNKLETPKNKKIKEVKQDIEKEINGINEELIKCYKDMSDGSVDIYNSRIKTLEGIKEGLKIALSKFE